jgi:hypothetical protein
MDHVGFICNCINHRFSGDDGGFSVNFFHQNVAWVRYVSRRLAAAGDGSDGRQSNRNGHSHAHLRILRLFLFGRPQCVQN